jgi:hypothetical protein
MRRLSLLALSLWLCLSFFAATVAADELRQFTFSWPFSADSAMRPRGGTSTGPEVTLQVEPSRAWMDLQQPGLTAFERDRRAILAMAGEFRSSFEFIETVGFEPGFEPARPYQSWSTEVVSVIEDSGPQISLQHIIVMFFVDRNGDRQGPVVQKHWRQDWVYEDASLHEYVGHERWRERVPDRAERRGRWSQSVFQVDDSPRYEAFGNFVHAANYSAWTSDETRRPLPRRESSVRDDYDVLIGTNRHTITPTGWVQEEENLKAVLESDAQVSGDSAYLAREIGLNRYERIVDFDFSAGREYWALTGAFWADVRSVWRDIYSSRSGFTLAERVDDEALFQPMFEFAYELEQGTEYDPAAGRAFIRATLERYLD